MKQGYETADGFHYEMLKKFAKDSRRYGTEEEHILWNILSGKKLGHKFRRQHIIGEYIVDFVCLKCKLVVEVDGKYHFTEEQMARDAERTKFLESNGFTVIRFTNEEIIANTDYVLEIISNCAKRFL